MDDLYVEIMGSRAGYELLDTTLGIVTERLAGDLPEAELLKRYEPRNDWFSREESRRGVHGVPHEARVLVLAETLSRLEVLAGLSLDQDVVDGLLLLMICEDMKKVLIINMVSVLLGG